MKAYISIRQSDQETNVQFHFVDEDGTPVSDLQPYLGAMGHLVCLDTKTGKALWTKDLTKEYQTKSPVWGYSAHPLISGYLLYT